MYEEEDLLPISALQHLVYCERQCALIHIERIWEENRFTVEGKIMHERVHEPGCESRGNLKIEYGVPLRSLRLGLVGKADVVEFYLFRNEEPAEHMGGGQQDIQKEEVGGGMKGTERLWRPFPVEYKRGRPKADTCDKVQLCAQALCLEEMSDCQVSDGALFYGKRRRRLDVSFDDALRRETEKRAKRVHELIRSGRTPRPEYSPKCENCSLVHSCMPELISSHKSVSQYLLEAVKAR